MKRVFVMDPVVNEYTVEVLAMTWENPLPDDLSPLQFYPFTYKIRNGAAVVHVKQTSPYCVLEGATTVDFGAADGTLTVEANGSYTGNVSKNFSFSVTATCEFPDVGRVTTTNTLEESVGYNMNGVIVDGVMKGNIIDPGFPNITFSGAWNFVGSAAGI
jgi:hypothetical protein